MPESPPQDESPTDLSILLPAFNEEAAIGPVVAEIRQAMKGWPGTWELLVVDDASIDGTAERAAKAGARVIRRVENGGAGLARKTGIRAARGHLIAMLDADGSYDPHHLPELLAYFPEYDQVNGARMTEEGELKFLRVPAKWAIRKLTELISGKCIPDLNTGMKAFKRDTMLRYLWILPGGFSCVTSMTLAFMCNDHPVKYVPVPYRKRIGRSKFRPIKDSLNYLWTVIRIIMYFRPLRFFVPLSAAVLFLASAKAVYGMCTSPLGLHDSDVLMLILGALILGVGLLADLIVAQRRDLR